MSINRLYSKLLGDSQLQSDNYQRWLSDAEDTRTTRLDIRKQLVPPGKDRGYMNFCAEQLVQICRSSIFRNDLERLDPRNTYDYPFTGFPEKKTQIGALPDGFELALLEPSVLHTWIDSSVRIAIDPGAATATIGDVSYPYTMPSAAMPLGNGISVIFKGTLNYHVPPFLADLTFQRRPWRDNIELLAIAQDLAAQVAWHAPYAEYRAAPEADLLIAAFIMNYLEYDGN